MNTHVMEPSKGTEAETEWQPHEKPGFDEVYETVRNASQGAWDTLIDPFELTMRDGGLQLADVAGHGRQDLIPTAWATSQLCQRLGMPTAYFRRCPAELQSEQANHWLSQFARRDFDGASSTQSSGHTAGKERWLLRVQGDRLRAILSERYAPLDNEVLIEHLKPLIGDRYYADWFGMDDESLHLRLFDPSLKRDVLPHDPIMAGIHVSNSEVGKRAVTVDALLFRQICSNGMIALVRGKSLLRRRHIAIQGRDFEAELEEAVAQAAQAASGLMDRFAETARHPVTDVEKTLEQLGLTWDLAATTQELVKDALLREAPSQQQTLYGVINAVTNAAQRLRLDERYHLELLAGQLMQNGLPSTASGKRRSQGDTV